MSNSARKSVDYKFTKLVEFIKKVGLSRDDVKEVMGWGEVYGRILYANQGGVYRDDDFEELLISRCAAENRAVFEKVKTLKELHVISAPLATGGHTRLMEKIIGLREGGDVLISRPVMDVSDKLRLPRGTKIYCKEHGFDVSGLIEILAKYKTIFLHINPDDLLASVAVGVVRRSISNRVIFVNHADHVFSFGFCCSDLVAEVSSYGFSLSQKKRGVSSSFLGIPMNLVDLKKIEFNAVSRRDAYFEILSAGSPLKYKPNAVLSFPRLARRILKEIPSARVTIVGPEFWVNWWWWLVKLRNPYRLRILKSMPYDEYISTLAGVSIYLDSLPMTGGTALPEVRSKGIPVSGILSGSSGYTPFDAAKFSDIDRLVEALRDYSLGNGDILFRRNNDQNTIDSAFRVHGLPALKRRLDRMVDDDEIFRPYDDGTFFDTCFYRDQWRSEGVINISLSSFKFFLKNWYSGGKGVLLVLINLISARQALYWMRSVLMKILLRKP